MTVSHIALAGGPQLGYIFEKQPQDPIQLGGPALRPSRPAAGRCRSGSASCTASKRTAMASSSALRTSTRFRPRRRASSGPRAAEVDPEGVLPCAPRLLQVVCCQVLQGDEAQIPGGADRPPGGGCWRP